MEPPSAQWEQFEARIASLEKRDEENRRENQELKNANTELHETIAALRLENTAALERMDLSMQQQSDFERKVLDSIAEIKNETQNQPSTQCGLETLESCDKGHPQKGGLEFMIQELREQIQENKAKVEATSDKVDEVEDSVNAMQGGCQATCEKVEEVDIKLKATSVVCRVTDAKTCRIKEDLQTKDKSACFFPDDENQAAFVASIRAKQPMVVGKWTSLECYGSLSTLGMGKSFKRDCCQFQCSRNGLYGVGLLMVQKGQGNIRMGIKINGALHTSGSTHGEWDVCNRFFVSRLTKGNVLTAEYLKVQGPAEIHFCEFFSFLICFF